MKKEYKDILFYRNIIQKKISSSMAGGASITDPKEKDKIVII